MKHIVIIFIFVATGVFSCKTAKNTQSESGKKLQSKIYEPAYSVSARTKVFLADIANEENLKIDSDAFILSQNLIDKYSLQKIENTYSVSGFIKTAKDFDKSKLENLGITIGPPAGNISTVNIPLSSLPDFLQLENIEYFEIAEKAQPK